jgi:hypothetical protein
MRKGYTVEQVAKSIAKDHLQENPNYYKILNKLKLAKGGEVVCRSCSNSWFTYSKEVGQQVYTCDKCKSDNKKYYVKNSSNVLSKGGVLSTDKKELYREWKNLVNMSVSELKTFYDSKEGKEAGLSADEAREQGIDRGRTSARWIIKMLGTDVAKWTPEMWKWCKKQISFIKRMSGNKGDLYDEDGTKTRKHTSLLIWGHNPEKYETGGSIDNSEYERVKQKLETFGIFGLNSAGKKSVSDYLSVYSSPERVTFFANGDRFFSALTDDILGAKSAQQVLSKSFDEGELSEHYNLDYEEDDDDDYDDDDDDDDDFWKKYAKGGQTPSQKRKVAKVMGEFKRGLLHSSSGDLVTDRDQAVAIALSEAGLSKYDKGGRTIAQTPAPKSDRIYGSKVNPKGSAKDAESARSIKFDESTTNALKSKMSEFNSENPDKKVSLDTLKAVMRRGLGAYSASHRPTISGGKPNSRVAWGLARVDAFLRKKGGGKAKKAYVQDDDLMFAKKGMKVPKGNRNGDCYETAGKFALNNLKGLKGHDFVGIPYVVHAEVEGQGAIAGIRYGHAWIEDDVMVYDFSNGREIIFPKVLYYHLGNVIQEQPKYFKYTFEEATRKMLDTGHYGSWDLITESGL